MLNSNHTTCSTIKHRIFATTCIQDMNSNTTTWSHKLTSKPFTPKLILPRGQALFKAHKPWLSN